MDFSGTDITIVVRAVVTVSVAYWYLTRKPASQPAKFNAQACFVCAILMMTAVEGQLFSSSGQLVTRSALGAQSVFAADLDGDGAVDVLSASANDDKIAWYRNFGNGIFSEQMVITTSALQATSVFAADLDSDGAVDVLSASYGDNTVAWYRNFGNGSFSAPQIITSWARDANSVFAADLNGDGFLDVLSASSGDNRIAWYQNLGNGAFSAPNVITNLADTATSVFAADLDGDGAVDVLSASAGDNKIAWYRNLLGQNETLFSTQRIITSSAFGASSVFAADLNGDGAVDVVSASTNDNKIAWYRNLGNGSFSELQQIITASAMQATSVVVVDLNCDGKLDVVFASYADNTVAWCPNLGGGKFSPKQEVISSSISSAISVFAADLSGDAVLDVLAASFGDDGLSWFRNLGDQTFSESDQRIVSSTVSADPQSVLAVDLNGDGALDVLLAVSNGVAWYRSLNRSNDTFAEQQMITTLFTRPNSVFAADLSGDGIPDVLFASNSWLYHNIAWIRSFGNGSFSDQQRNISTSLGVALPAHVFAADLNGDGSLDVLSSSGGIVSWYRNLGNNGTFPDQQQVIARGSIFVTAIFAADLDGDGDMDVLFASQTAETIQWRRNLGNGAFGSEAVVIQFASSYPSLTVLVADLDGDGALDVLAASANDNSIKWYQNLLRNGTFSSGQLLTRFASPISAFAADMNADGALDVLFASSESGYNIAWCRNLGNGQFSEQHFLNISAESVLAADFNGDGALDLLTASSNNIALHPNHFFPRAAPLLAVIRSKDPSASSAVCFAFSPTLTLCGHFTIPTLAPFATLSFPFSRQQGGLDIIEFSVGPALALTKPAVFDRTYATRRLLLIFPREGLDIDCSLISSHDAEACVVIRRSIFGSGTELLTYGGQVRVSGGGKVRGLLLDSCSDDTGNLFWTQPFPCEPQRSSYTPLNFPCSGLFLSPGPSLARLPIAMPCSGLQLVDCGSSSSGGGGGRGGAASIQASTLCLRNVHCINSTSELGGGGLAIISSSAVSLLQSVFSGNGAVASGGGIFVDDASSLVLSSCVLVGNTAKGDGGGLAIASGSVQAFNATWHSNTATGNGGAVSCVTASDGYLILRSFFDALQSYFTNNSANLDGGALFLKACLPNRTMHWSLAEATISGNFAQLRGGGVYCESDSTLLAVNTTILSNSALFGGGMYISVLAHNKLLSPFQFSGNSMITNNRANGGGGIFWAVPLNTPPEELQLIAPRKDSCTANTASYGADAATNALALRIRDHSVSFRNQTSGHVVDGRLEIDLLDLYDQVVVTDNTTRLLLVTSAMLQGTVQPYFLKGSVNFTLEFSIIAKPGSVVNLSFVVTSNTSTIYLPPAISIPLRPCNPGEHEEASTNLCKLCLEGSFSNVTGASACSSCIAGTFQNETGKSVCKTCHSGTFTNKEVGFTMCHGCKTNEYLSSGQCMTCIPNAICDGASIQPSAGYWLSAPAGVSAVQVFKCPENTCIDSENCASGRISPPSDNLLCGRCLTGFSEWSGVCVNCSKGANSGYIILLFLGGFGLCTVLYLVHRLPTSYSAVTPANRFGVLLYFLQTATLLVSASPSTSLTFFFHLVNFNLLDTNVGGQCLFPVSEHFTLFVPLLSQLFLLAMVPLLFGIWRYCGRRVPNTGGEWLSQAILHLRGDERQHWGLDAFLRCLVGVYWYGFYSVVGSSLRFFHCVTVRTAECEDCHVRVVQYHPSLDCDSPTYGRYSVVFGIVLAIELAVPLAISLALLRSGLKVEPTDRIFRIFSMFFRFYPSGKWTMLWELMGTFIKRVPLLCVIVFSSDAQSRLAWCVALIVLHLVLQLLVRPFLDPVDNLLETFSLTSLTMMIAILISSNLDALPSQEQAATQFAFFAVISLLLLAFVVTHALHRCTCDPTKQLNESLQRIRDKVFDDSISEQPSNDELEMSLDQDYHLVMDTVKE